MVQKKKSDEQDVLVVRDEKTGEIQRRRRTQQRRHTEASTRQGGEHARLPAF